MARQLLPQCYIKCLFSRDLWKSSYFVFATAHCSPFQSLCNPLIDICLQKNAIFTSAKVLSQHGIDPVKRDWFKEHKAEIKKAEFGCSDFLTYVVACHADHMKQLEVELKHI